MHCESIINIQLCSLRHNFGNLLSIFAARCHAQRGLRHSVVSVRLRYAKVGKEKCVRTEGSRLEGSRAGNEGLGRSS